MAKEGLRLSGNVAYPAGICFAILAFAVYAVSAFRINGKGIEEKEK